MGLGLIIYDMHNSSCHKRTYMYVFFLSLSLEPTGDLRKFKISLSTEHIVPTLFHISVRLAFSDCSKNSSFLSSFNTAALLEPSFPLVASRLDRSASFYQSILALLNQNEVP